MTSKADLVVKNVKDLQGDISAWEGRLDFVKSENEKLQRQNLALREEAKNMSSVIEQEAEQKRAETRRASAALEESRQKLEKDRTEFESILKSFKMERNDFEREKTATLDAKKNAEDTLGKCQIFIRMVKEQGMRLG